MLGFYSRRLTTFKTSLQELGGPSTRNTSALHLPERLAGELFNSLVRLPTPASDGPALSDPSDLGKFPHWHASHSPPLRMASIEQAIFSSALNSRLAPTVWLMTELRISFWNSAVLFSMFEALRVRR